MSVAAQLDALGAIAAEAAAEIRRSRPAFVEAKAYDDFVTDLDHRLEVQITARLGEAFPGVTVLGEEGLAEGDRLPADSFIVDPLDGTGNWIAGIPFCAVSIARITDGRTVLAAVADVYGDRVFTAAEGAGAFRNGTPLQVPPEPPSTFTLSTGVLTRTHAQPAAFTAMKAFGKLRNLGAQALNLCLVAEGALAAVASEEARLWDDAAGRLVATEAGAVYVAGVDAAERDRPHARQNSLAVHPAIQEPVRSALAPVLKIDVPVPRSPASAASGGGGA